MTFDDVLAALGRKLVNAARVTSALEREEAAVARATEALERRRANAAQVRDAWRLTLGTVSPSLRGAVVEALRERYPDLAALVSSGTGDAA